MCYTYVYPSFVGDLCMVADESSLLSVTFNDGLVLDWNEDLPDSSVIREAVRQMNAYFAGTLRCFDLPLRFSSTKFTVDVWRALQEIPYGTVCTYGEIASRVSSGNASRAVGSACRRNPFAVIVPCHRVVSVAKGAGSGYAGGLDKKFKLLDFEKSNA